MGEALKPRFERSLARRKWIDRALDFPRPFPGPARRYVLIILLLGLPVAIFSLVQVLAAGEFGWMVLALAAVLASNFPLRIPLIKGNIMITLGDLFTYLALFLFGVEAAVLVGVCEGFSVNFRLKAGPVYRHFFNVSQVALAALGTGLVFNLLGGNVLLDLVAPGSSLRLMMMGLLCSFLFYGLSSALVVRGATLANGGRFLDLWQKSLGWSLGSIVSALVAVLLYLAW